MSKSIFVQMASYRDPQLIPTLLDMAKNAVRPEELRVCVNWQHGADEPIEIFTDAKFEILSTEIDDRVAGPVIHMVHESGLKVDAIDIHFYKSKGACWARNQIQQLYDNERYTLQLDSHHRFVEGWDDIVIDMLEDLRKDGYSKPILTAYIPSFDPDNDPAGRAQEPWEMTFDRMIPEGTIFFLPKNLTDWQDVKKPVRGRFFSAHFAFADGSFAVEVQHDPLLYFHSEEQSIATRAFTHGYDIFYPNKIIAYHEYTRKGRTKNWDDHDTESKNDGKIEFDWVERNDASHKRNRILFGMDGEDPTSIDFGKYGFGTVRTLKDYENFAGISFKHRAITQECKNHVYPPGTIEIKDDDPQWVNENLIRSNDVRILVFQDDLRYEDGTVPDDFEFWYVGAADDELNEVHRRDATESEIKQYMSGGYADFRLIWYGNGKATKYVIWPYSKSKGWRHERIIKDIVP